MRVRYLLLRKTTTKGRFIVTFSISENERRNELASLRDVKVVQANDLITSVAKMEKIPLKIFELAVAQIDIENPP